MTPADLVKLARAAKSGKKVTSGLSAAKEAATISKMQQAGELPLSAAEIQAAKMSKADSVAAGYYHPVGGGLKLKRPIGEMEFTRVPDPNMPLAPEIIITPEDLYKTRGQGYPLTYDVSAAGEILTGMNKKKFKTPVVLQGGEGYQRTHGGIHSTEKTAAASQPGVISRHSKIIQQIAREGDQPISVVLAMGPSSSLEYNKMMSNSLLQQLDAKSIPASLAKIFDAQIREQFPQFVGIKSPNLPEQLLADEKHTGNLRKHFANTMNESLYRNSGVFPDVVETRVAISSPTMMNAQLGSGGSSFGLMDPSGKIIGEEALNPHDTYKAKSAGEYMGGFGGARLKVQELFPTYFEERSLLGTPAPEDKISSTDWYSFGRRMPTQRYDQEWLDKVMPIYEKRMKEMTGKKKGGLAHMAGGGTPEPKRKSILDLTPLTEAAAAVQNAFKAESRTSGDKGATMDIINRGQIAPFMGAAVDIPQMALEGIDWLQSKIPGLRKPASVMDTKNPIPQRQDPAMGYVPKFPLATDEPFGGTAHAQRLMREANITSGTERPMMEAMAGMAAPFAPAVASKAAKVAQAVAPRAGDLASQFINKQAEAMGLPLEMGIVPEDKISKIALRQEPESLVKGVAPGQEMFVQHNVSTDKLIKADKLGAMPMPSLAISKTDAPLDSFGEITLIAPKEFATPSAKNPIYKTDAYTKTRPYTEYKIDDKSEKNLKNVFSDVMDKVPDAEYSLDRAINEWGDKDYRDIFRAKFLNEKGLLPNKDEFKNADEFSQEMNYIVRELQPEYKDWMNNFETSLPDLGVNVKETIFKGYSPSGKRKYVPADLENIVKEMKGGAGSQNWHGVGQLRAVATPKFKNFSEIKASRSNLLSGKEMNDVKDQAANAYDDLLSRLRELSRYHADDALLEVAETRNLSALDRIYGDKITPELKADIYTYLDKLKKLPSEYFEIKPQRAVDIGEFAGAIIPADSPKVVRDILERRGVKNIHEYSTPEERKSLIKKFGKEMFAAAPVGVALKEKEEKHAKGGAVRMAEGGSVPKAPSNWTDYLSQHAQEESMRLMGGDTALNPMKDGGSIDDMIRNAVEKANSRNYASGGAVNIDDLIQKAITLRNQHA